jgi:hypothetical protein
MPDGTVKYQPTSAIAAMWRGFMDQDWTGFLFTRWSGLPLQSSR